MTELVNEMSNLRSQILKIILLRLPPLKSGALWAIRGQQLSSSQRSARSPSCATGSVPRSWRRGSRCSQSHTSLVTASPRAALPVPRKVGSRGQSLSEVANYESCWVFAEVTIAMVPASSSTAEIHRSAPPSMPRAVAAPLVMVLLEASTREAFASSPRPARERMADAGAPVHLKSRSSGTASSHRPIPRPDRGR